MGISVTRNNEIRLLTFIFAIKRKKNIDNVVIRQKNKVKWNIDRHSYLEVAYMFNEQFTYLARTVFGNPTLNLCLKFLKIFGIFYFCRDFVPELWTYRRCRFNAIPFSTWYVTSTFRLIPQIIRHISKFKDIFHQFWGCSSFNFEYLSH